MVRFIRYGGWLCFLQLLLSGSLLAGPNPVMDSAVRRIAAFHAGEKTNGALLRVVYFHAADREPLPDFSARLDRSLTDISAFYREGMEQRFAVKTGGLPLERKGGKLVVHVVRGRHPAAHYSYKSGDETWSEVRQALAGKLDPEREHVLISYGLCAREADGRFVFTAPYYGAGWSDQRHGLCHAADCDLLDPLLLTRKDQPFVFKEHAYERRQMSVAEFNSWYLGGLAHELGHGLGFPHDSGAPDEAPGFSLMGLGNLHYRENLWGGQRPAYLALATALRFAAHPLVTQSDKARWQPAEAVFDNLAATASNGTLRLTGRVHAGVPPCAVIAAAWPATAKTDHTAMTFCAAVDDGGNFALELSRLKAPVWQLRLAVLLVNGAETREKMTLLCNAQGAPDAADFNANWQLNRAEQMQMRQPEQAGRLLSEAAIAAAPTAEAGRRLRLLRDMQTPAPAPLELTTCKDMRAYLSDAHWTTAKVGWGQVVRNRYWFNPGQWEGLLLKIKGDVFAKGLYAHASSCFVFPLGGRWKSFTATIGLRDGAADQGSAIFTVKGDGRELCRSKILRVGQRETVRLDLSGVQQLELLTTGGEGHNHNAWSIWADPLVQR